MDDTGARTAGVSRQFGTVRALTAVSFDCRPARSAPVGETAQASRPPRSRQGSSTPIRHRRTGQISYRALTLSLSSVWRWPTRMAVRPRRARQEQPFYAATSGRPHVTGAGSGALEGSPSSTSTWSCPRCPGGTLTTERQLFEVAKALVTSPRSCSHEPTTAVCPEEWALHRTIIACKRRGIGGLRQPSAAEVLGLQTDHGVRTGSTKERSARRRRGNAAGRTNRRTPVRGGVPAWVSSSSSKQVLGRCPPGPVVRPGQLHVAQR